MAAPLDPVPGRDGRRVGSRRSRRTAHRRDHRVVGVRPQRGRPLRARHGRPRDARANGAGRWARHWPLLIIVLAGFVAYSVDPEGWQTGAVGFWEHLLSPEVVQHRILLILTALFGFAEWRVRSGRHPDSPWRYVFPIVAIWSGVLLLAHVHEVSDGKSAFFMELSHLAARPCEPAGGLGTLARAPAASRRERPVGPDLGVLRWPSSGCCSSCIERDERVAHPERHRGGNWTRAERAGAEAAGHAEKVGTKRVCRAGGVPEVADQPGTGGGVEPATY